MVAGSGAALLPKSACPPYEQTWAVEDPSLGPGSYAALGLGLYQIQRPLPAKKMIPQRYLREFLKRPVKNYRSVKHMTKQEMARLYDRLPMGTPFWKKLSHDQKLCFLIGAYQSRFAFFNDPSTGKTFLTLALSEYFYQLRQLDRVLVLVPRRANKGEWNMQVEQHCPDVGCTVIQGTDDDKWRLLRGGNTLITVETYSGFTRMVCDDVGNGKLEINYDLLDELRERFNGFIFDESSELGGGAAAVDERSLIFQICDYLSAEAFMTFALSGTPFGRDPSMLWAQMFLVDRGETLGKGLGIFKEVFFGKKDYWGRREYLERRNKDLYRLLANRSIRFEVPESEIPRKIPQKKYVVLPEEQRDWYERLMEILRNDPDKSKKFNAFLRMRQLSSGFVGVPGDEDGEKSVITFQQNPKLESLGAYARSIPPQYQFLVFHDFTVSGEMVANELERLGIEFMTIRGKTKDPETVLRKFRTGSKPGLVINSKSGDFGLNLQTACYALFYDIPVSAITRTQTEKRIIRRFSEHEWCVIVDFICRGTRDERILEFHAQGRNYFEAIMDGREKL